MGSRKRSRRDRSSSSSSASSASSKRSPKRGRSSDSARHRKDSPAERSASRYRRGSPRRDTGRHSRGSGNNYRQRNSGNESRGFGRGRGRGNRRRSRSRSFDHANARWGKEDNQPKEKRKDMENKAKPDFGLSGKLTEETNTYKGVVIKYSEPPEARKPRRRWRLYPFKGEKALQTLYIHRESAYLIGRDRKVVDLAVDHPSCSKQHAALQYRLVPFTRENGSAGKRVRPYLIDLESANGTFINNNKIEPKKYVELLERDVIKFGFSSREYVLLHENSKDEAMDDDVKPEDEQVKEEPILKAEKD
ncbi:smad nuclear interacting protein 1 [Dendroctonus ponderosae]|uniref:FHA domain-containing protein n=1 Tax=Dendroctonus ponderosae TaxID=77166 RepID=A0AAR5PY57_DENPD|nr:smad nuclear interacting protein 1 [Dendroctonus ponderosae]KAH1022631.1 hypothetical protein HUJ04_012009 [Dendroctonus ponderosae]KAH1029117.1 hypothetical protein HUJ05_002416 [Dendroctonus ponderosae]